MNINFDERAIEALSERVPKSENEYLDPDDGLLHCSICHRAVQTKVEFLGIQKTVRCICDCRVKEMNEQKERERQQDRTRQRNICFGEDNMSSWTFENDDRRNEKLSDAMIRYTENFRDFKKDGKGLLLYGPVGTGKTFYAACIANRLIDNDFSVLMTNFAKLTNKLQGMYEGKQEYIDNLNNYSLLIIDDLGAERKSEYMQEMVFNIIDSRYRSGLPFIITTNLTANELKAPNNIGYSRIYDRVLERCFPVVVEGGSRRIQSLRETHADVKSKLGL